MKIEIVSHCYAAELPHYAAALRYQLSSLILDNPKKCGVTVTVCYCKADRRTLEVFYCFFRGGDGPGMKGYGFGPGDLGRRAIGRNVAAKETQADLVWFADVDQCYREGILDRLATMEWPDGASMVYPREIKIHRDHATGDACLAEAGGVCDVDPSEFVTKRYGRAIGGVQIVRGDFAREHGYLDGDPKWQRPTDGRFDACHCDRAYRSFCQQHGPIVGVDLPGLYRIRHSVAGHGRPPSTGGAGFREGK